MINDTMIVNVKGMPRDVWEQARRSSSRTGETLVEWLTRAIRQLADAEAAGDRILPPAILTEEPPLLPAVIPPQPIPALDPIATLTALHAIGIPIQKRIGRLLQQRLAEQLKV